MARPLLLVDTSEPLELQAAIRGALSGSGPAVMAYTGSVPVLAEEMVPDEVALVVETSGSTRTPKRVWHTAGSLRAAANQVNRKLEGGQGVWWSVLPTHYVAGLMIEVRAIEGGGAVFYRQSGESLEESLASFSRWVNVHQSGLPRYTSLVPKQLADLVEIIERKRSALRSLLAFDRILVGGQRVDPRLIERATDLGVRVTRTYGAAETAGGCVWDGVPLGETTVDIFEGNVAVSGAMLAGGYLGDDELTRSHFVDYEGLRWFVSNDIGQYRNGQLEVSGREDRVVISGGVKINVNDVELALQAHFGTLEILVLPTPDSIWGESLAIVTTRDLDIETVQQVAKRLCGPTARVQRVLCVPEIPLLPSGKPDLVSLHGVLA